MNREQLLTRLGFFLNPANGIGAALYFVVNEGGESVIKFADVDDNVKNELKERFLQYITEKFTDNESLHYQNISEADDRKNVVYKYDLDERPESLNILNEILLNDEQEHFNFNTHSLADVSGYLITIGNEVHKIALYKKSYPFNLLKRDRFLLVPSNERLVKVDNEAIVLDNSFDFMMVDETLIVLKLATIERHFGFEQVIRNQALNTITLIDTQQLLENVDQMHALAQNLNHARKLMKIGKSPVLTLPVQNIIQFINGHPELNGKIVLNDIGNKIMLTTQISKKLFLKLLNDDYLFSNLTELEYDSHSKDKLQEIQNAE